MAFGRPPPRKEQGNSVKIVAAAIQMPSQLLEVSANLEHADDLLREAHQGGAQLAVLPEMFNTGYGLLPDYAPVSEGADGRTVRLLEERSRLWGMTIAAGFVERSGRHLYDSLALCTPRGGTEIYRKRHLVFWERFRFRPGRAPLVVKTPFGRVGLAVCADMIYRRVWSDYRGRIDVAIVAAAWPDFANRHTGRPHWLMGHVGPMSAEIPAKVASDLGIPVVFANQCGLTRTTIPVIGMWVAERLPDRFAGTSSVCDGRQTAPVQAGGGEEIVLSDITLPSRVRGPLSCHSTYPSDRADISSASAA
jgi:N-carbamoylputrescine amidase